MEMRQMLYEDLLRRLPDFQKLAKKFQRKKSSLQDCFRVYQAIEKIPQLVELLEKHDGIHRATISEVFVKPLQVNSLLKLFQLQKILNLNILFWPIISIISI